MTPHPHLLLWSGVVVLLAGRPILDNLPPLPRRLTYLPLTIFVLAVLSTLTGVVILFAPAVAAQTRDPDPLIIGAFLAGVAALLTILTLRPPFPLSSWRVRAFLALYLLSASLSIASIATQLPQQGVSPWFALVLMPFPLLPFLVPSLRRRWTRSRSTGSRA